MTAPEFVTFLEDEAAAFKHLEETLNVAQLRMLVVVLKLRGPIYLTDWLNQTAAKHCICGEFTYPFCPVHELSLKAIAQLSKDRPCWPRSRNTAAT